MKSKSNAMLELNGVENAIYRYGTFNFRTGCENLKTKTTNLYCKCENIHA